MNLFDRIMSLRVMGIAVYEKARIENAPAEKYTDYLAPLTKELHDSIESYVRDDVPGSIQAMALLQEVAEAHKTEAKRQLEKAEDVLAYVNHVKQAFLDRMRRENVTVLRDGDSMVVLNVVNGKPFISYR